MGRDYSCEEEAQYYAAIAEGEEEAMMANQAAAAEAEVLAKEAEYSQLRAEIAQEIRGKIKKISHIGSHQNLETLEYESCLIIDQHDWQEFWKQYEVKK